VIEKAAGDVARCSHDDGASGRLLELPIWMFDRSACAPMQVGAFPRVEIGALQALRVLLDATAIGGVAVGLASSNARFREQQGSLTTRIGERSMRRQRQLRHDRRSRTQQFDLFATRSGSSTAPTLEWRTLPAPTRQALTALLMRLIFDHAAGDHRPQPRKVRHDV